MQGLNAMNKYKSVDYVGTLSSCKNFNYFFDSLPDQFLGLCVTVTWNKFNGIKYKVGTTVIVELSNDGDKFLPVFGNINMIPMNENEDICFVCNKMTTNGFDRDYHAFKLELDDAMLCATPEIFISSFPAILVNKRKFMYATVKHTL